MSKAVIFGAGNIGRSFIGSIFASNGWEVTFIDANQRLVDLLNSRGSYPILIKRGGQPDETVIISGISALHSSEADLISERLKRCTLCCTSVGQGALPYVVPVIAEAVKSRADSGEPPLDVIIAENIRNGADYFRGLFRENGLDGDEAGLVETSIGKMVPMMTEQDLGGDPLVLHAEEYNSLILDSRGFKGDLPDFPEIKAVRNISAWVDRKLFIHNLGHAAAAYLGFKSFPERKLIAGVIADDGIRRRVKAAMAEAAAALLAEYPDDFTKEALDDHIEDLIFRFGNLALGDTVYRVGRDLPRKLNRNDRIIGAAALCLKHGLPCPSILEVFRAAIGFRAADGNGRMYEGDSNFHSILEQDGAERLIGEQLGLTASDGDLAEILLKYV